MSGALWAWAYEPIVRSILAAIPWGFRRRGVFTDHVGLVARHRFEAMHALQAVPGDRAAANLRLNASKSQPVDFSVDSPEPGSGELRLFAIIAEAEGVRHGRCLGVLVGPAASDHTWTWTVGESCFRVRP